MQLRICLLIILGIAASACTPWPQKGGGGVAELHNSPMFPLDSPGESADKPITFRQALKLRLDMANDHLSDLKVQGVANCFPAQWQQTMTFSHRVTREIDAGLYLDAGNDIIILEQQVNSLTERLNYIEDRVDCRTRYAGQSRVSGLNTPERFIK